MLLDTETYIYEKENMFTLDQLFDQIFPWMTGISWDLGTVLTGLVFLWVLAEAFNLLSQMLLGRIGGYISDRDSDHYLDQARKQESMAMEYSEGSIEREYHSLMQKSYLNDSVRSKRRKR